MTRRSAVSKWQSCARTPTLTGATTFRFLDVERDIATRADWNRSDWPKLWLYNAHYFDDLVADGATSRHAWHEALITRWIAENPAPRGNGWEPYPTSLRIVNWVKWALAGNTLPDGATDSLATQADWLSRRLEYHLLANHLWANAKALVFAGSFLVGPRADEWRRLGTALLRNEIPEQFLTDGGHFERSPMYHSILLEDLVDLVQLAALYPDLHDPKDVTLWREVAERARGWLTAMTHPDGEISFFNDAAFGIAPAPAAIHAYAESVGVDTAPATHWLADTGYARIEVPRAVAIVDVGEVGPTYQPGHAHADTLSFEFSLDERRVLVNTGTSTYGVSPERARQRGTAAHNTVTIDDADSSEVWAGFRCARRAIPRDVEVTPTTVKAAHDGYERLAGSPIHRRWCDLEPGMLRVIDRIERSFDTAVARFHVHPDCAVTIDDERSGAIRVGEAAIRWRAEGASTCRVLPSTWHPRFGHSVDNRVIEIAFAGDKIMTTFAWDER